MDYSSLSLQTTLNKLTSRRTFPSKLEFAGLATAFTIIKPVSNIQISKYFDFI